MEDWIKVIMIIFPIFVIGMIVLDELDATKLSILWLFICIVLELIISKLFALHAIGDDGSENG